MWPRLRLHSGEQEGDKATSMLMDAGGLGTVIVMTSLK